MSHQKSKAMKHEHDKSQDMKTSQRLWPALVIASQAPKAGRPGETALHHPSARQQHEAAFGLWQCDHLQAYALRCRRLSRFLTGVASIDVGQLHRSSGASCTACASSPTCARSCSEAGVTCKASRFPSVSTAAWILL